MSQIAAKSWFAFKAAAETGVVDIHIVDIIGSWDDDWIARNFGYDMGVTARAFVEALAALPAETRGIRVHINSPGGDVFAALNIANALRDQQTSKGRTVETIIDGLAASAASIVAMAGKTVTMADNALLMVHNPWVDVVGNAAELRRAADSLDTVRETIVATYQWHSSLSAEEIVQLLDAETWMSAAEAKDRGFVTDVAQGLQAAALLSPKALERVKVPAKYKDRLATFTQRETPPPAAMPVVEVLAACQAARLDLPFAQALIADGLTPDRVAARIADEQTRRTTAEARERDIRAACQTAGLPEFAADLIAGGMTVAASQATLTRVTALRDRVEIDANLPPDHRRQASAAVIDTAAIYQERNRLH